MSISLAVLVSSSYGTTCSQYMGWRKRKFYKLRGFHGPHICNLHLQNIWQT